jgi:hypothetical protein
MNCAGPWAERPRQVLHCRTGALFGPRLPDAVPGVSPGRIRLTLIQLARLIFDSRSQPALAGVRGGTAGPDRFLFQGGNLVLDVMVEPRLEGEPVSLLGQIFDPQNPANPYDNLPVALVRDAGELVRTTTNQSGEFHLSFSPDENLLLLVQLRHQAVLVSPLPVWISQN